MEPAVSLLVIVLSHGGYCLGGGLCDVEVRWSAQGDVAPAILTWQLAFAHTVLADGRLRLEAGESPARLSLALPEVRAVTRLTWSYQLRTGETDEELERGERSLTVFPDAALKNMAASLRGQRIVVLDAQGELAGLLTTAGVSHRRVDGWSDLRLQTVDMVLVGAGHMRGPIDGHAVLVEQAQYGAGVLVLVQPDCTHLTGYPLAVRRITSGLAWRAEHPLFENLSEADLRSWIAASSEFGTAIQLPPDEAAFEVTYWPAVAPAKPPVPLDALIVEKQIGRGRLILCQLPAVADLDDPRTRQFLANALDYLRTRPQPTPRQADRLPTTRPADPADVPVQGVQP